MSKKIDNKTVGIVLIIVVLILGGLVFVKIKGASKAVDDANTAVVGKSGTPLTSSQTPTQLKGQDNLKVGEMGVLSTDSGSIVTATLQQIIDPAPTTTNDALGNKKPVSVKFEIQNDLSSPYSGNANLQTTVIGSDNQTYNFTLLFINSSCTDFNAGTISLSQNEKAVGCIQFALPQGVTVSKVKFAGGLTSNSSTSTWVNK